MKPARFEYHCPSTVDEAARVLAEAGDDTRVLAGGQSLIPLLNTRQVRPRHVVDINRIPELSFVRVTDDGVHVGAAIRQVDVERDDTVWSRVPLLRQALRFVGHPVIRNRGTVVGSLAHADPCGELPVVLALLGGTVDVVRQGGRRSIPAADLYLGPWRTSLRPDELVVSAYFPCPDPGTGVRFVEISRRSSDQALCGAAAAVTIDADLRIMRARAAYVGVTPTPRVVELTAAFEGLARMPTDWSAAAELASGALDPPSDLHATATYRRHLINIMTERALASAAGNAVRNHRNPTR